VSVNIHFFVPLIIGLGCIVVGCYKTPEAVNRSATALGVAGSTLEARPCYAFGRIPMHIASTRVYRENRARFPLSELRQFDGSKTGTQLISGVSVLRSRVILK
jgi:hypothetical protein